MENQIVKIEDISIENDPAIAKRAISHTTITY